MLKNYEAVAFQLKTALVPLPLKCAYIDLAGQRYLLKGDAKACAQQSEGNEGVHHEEISSGGMAIGPLFYVLDTQAFPQGSTIYLLFAFFGLVLCVVLTWAVLIKMINGSILSPLRGLTASLVQGEYAPDTKVTCDEVVSLSDQIRTFRALVSSSAKREEFVRVARMVAHNIDTPVMVLEGIDASGLNDKSRAIYRSALTDIKDLVNNLRSQASTMKQEDAKQSAFDGLCSDLNASFGTPLAKVGTTDLSTEHIMGLVEMAVSEKRLQNRTPYEITFEPSSESYGAFAKVQRTEFKCILLNLLNNAIESFQSADRRSGRITVKVTESKGWVQIAVDDDGPGIDPVVFPRLGESGFSVGKENGSGLGLHHAKSMATNWGGNLRIKSELGRGTLITVELPATAPPEWFVTALSLPPNGQVAVLDDDPKIGLIWKRRFANVGLDESAFTAFERAEDFRNWVQSRGGQNVLHLVDYELPDQNENGINVIETLGIAESSILVTGRYDDPTVRGKAQWLGIRMIPKPSLEFVLIEGAFREKDLKFDGQKIVVNK